MMREIASAKPRYGYRRIGELMARARMPANHKRVYRIYREEGLAVRRKGRRKVRTMPRMPIEPASRPNQRWSADFMSDTLSSGRRFRTLNVADDCSRKCLAIEADTSIRGTRVVGVLDRIATKRGYPDELSVDNGPEFTGKALDRWAYQHGVRLRFIDPGKPNQNALIESFNGKFRDECLDQNWFLNLDDARRIIAGYEQEYNSERPHSSLGYATPDEYEQRHKSAVETVENPPGSPPFPQHNNNNSRKELMIQAV